MEISIEKRVKDSFTRQNMMASIGASITRVERIRIDCVSAANHDLIRWLNKPGSG